MNNRLTIAILILFIAAAAPAATAPVEGLLLDGFGLQGLEGKLTTLKKADQDQYIEFDGPEVWLFELGADVNDLTNVVKAGTILQLLPTTALGKIIPDVPEHPAGTYRVWGKVTKYKGRNYIFSEYFLPVVELKAVEPVEPNKPQTLAPEEKPEAPKTSPEPNESPVQKELLDPNEPTTLDPNAPTTPDPNEPPQDPNKPPKSTAADQAELLRALTDVNGILEMPKELLDKFESRKIFLPKKIKPRPKPKPKPKQDPPPEKNDKKDAVKESEKTPEKVPEQEPAPARPKMKLDSMLTDRTAVLIKQDDGLVFVLEALGLSVQDISLRLLPCEMLELTEARQQAAFNRPRFKIAGIKTEFKGKKYFLLQKATRTFTHGNFGI